MKTNYRLSKHLASALFCSCILAVSYAQPSQSDYKLTMEWGVDASLEGKPWREFDQYMAKFGFNATEHPENCNAEGFAHKNPDMPHLSSVYDNTLKKHVLKLDIHTTPFLDRERCETHILNKQRNEIRTIDNNKEWAKIHANYDEWQIIEWKFKLPADFKPSNDFFHIYQLKDVDGPDRGLPLITLTPKIARNESSKDRMTLYNFGRTESGIKGTLVDTPNLDDYKDEWVSVRTEAHFSEKGYYSIIITRIRDGKVLMSYKNNNIDMWRGGSSYIRCKFGLYRGLGGNVPVNADGSGTLPVDMHNESIWLADFKIYEANTNPNPSVSHR